MITLTILALPESVSLTELINRIGKSDRQIIKYRQLAFKHVPDYRDSCNKRSPEYIRNLADYFKAKKAGKRPKRPYPDPPPFHRREAEILEAISSLFDEFNSLILVEYEMKKDPYFYLKNLTHLSPKKWGGFQAS